MNPKPLSAMTAIVAGVVLLAGCSGASSPSTQATSSKSPVSTPTFVPSTPIPNLGPDVRSMQLVDSEMGWALTGNGLFAAHLIPEICIQRGAGCPPVEAPMDITPPGLSPDDIKAVHFLDAGHGWIVANGTRTNAAANDTTSTTQLVVYRTSSAGRAWISSPLGQASDLYFITGKDPAYIDFIDPNNGWVVVSTQHTMNEVSGDLYHTDDGGGTWTQLAIPSGEPTYFADTNNGWLVSQRSGLFTTHDGGVTWQQDSSLVFEPCEGCTVAFALPIEESNGKLLLPASWDFGGGASGLKAYELDKGAWSLRATSPHIPDQSQAMVTQALPDGAVFGLSAIGTTGLILTPASTVFEVFSPEGLNGSPYDLDFADETRGWALVQASGGPAPKIATWQQVYIEQTDDGGHTWAPVFLPKGTPTPSP